MHNIMYETYSEKTSEAAINRDVVNYVNSHGDRYGTDCVRFPTSKIFDNYNAARDYIESIDKGFYDGFGVKYYDFSKVKNTKKIDDLEAKIKETQVKKKEYETAHSIKAQKATLIGCPECGSKLNKERMRGERCPLCNTDLRSPTILERLASFDSRVKEYRKKIEEERLKEKKKAEIKWLVKFEYHS